MDCEDFVITPTGRSGIGVIQPQSGLDYPLVDPSEDIRYLIADFFLAYDDPGYYRATVEKRKHPLRIKWIYGLGCEASFVPPWAPSPAHSVDILIVDQTDEVVFDSTKLVPPGGDESYQSFQAINWGDDLVIYEWIGNDAVCRLLAYRAWPPAFEIEPKNWPLHITPTRAVLDERAIYKIPRRVKSLKVLSDNFVAGRARRTGVVLATGYNMRIDVATAPVGLRLNTNITFHAEPGEGIGKYDDCYDSESSPILRINGAAPNARGDFTMAGPDCIWIRQPTQIVDGRAVPVRHGDAATLAVGSNCPPCCDCPDYVETGRYMNRVAQRYATIGKKAHQVKLLHESNIDRWAEQRDCRLSRPLRLQMVAQNCPLMDVVMMYCNQCQACAENVRINIALQSFPGDATAEPECGYTLLYAPGYSGKEVALGGDYPNYYADLPPIDVGNSAYVKFRLRFTPKTYPHVVTGTLTAIDRYTNSPIAAGCELGDPPASAVATETLNCTELGDTVRSCNANT